MILPVTSALVIAGLIALFTGFLGTIFWTDGKPRGEIRNVWLRISLALAGCILIYLSVRLSTPDSRPRESEETVLLERIYELESLVQGLESDFNRLASFQDYLNQQHDETAKNISDTARRMAGATVEQISVGCGASQLREKPYGWEPNPTSSCGRLMNAFWEVEVVVLVASSQTELEEEWRQLGIPVRFPSKNELPGSRLPGLATPRLGLIFDEVIPRGLVCNIRQTFSNITGVEITHVMTSSTFRQLLKVPAPYHVVRIGVPFNDYFEERSGPSGVNWDALCGSDYDQETFIVDIDDMSKTYKLKNPPQETGQ